MYLSKQDLKCSCAVLAIFYLVGFTILFVLWNRKLLFCPIQICLSELVVPDISHDLCAYYQTSGKNKEAIHSVLTLFRISYPLSKLTLFFDGEGTELDFM